MSKLKTINFRCIVVGLIFMLSAMGWSTQSLAQTSKEYTDADVGAFETDLKAGTYDIYILATSGGIYDLNYPAIPKSTTIKAKSGLALRPVLKYTANTGGSNAILRVNGSSSPVTIVFDSLEFDGSGAATAPIIIKSDDESHIVMKNCYVHDATNSSGVLRLNNAGSSLDMQNTMITNSKQRIIDLYTAGALYGDINVANCTFSGITAGDVIYFRSASGIYAAGNNVTIDHCTFHNITGNVTRYKTDSIHGTVSVTNSIFEQVSGGLDADVIDYNYLAGLGTPPAGTNTQTTAPVFADAANMNFALTNKAEMVGGDFQTLGDLSWYTDDVPPRVLAALIKMDDTHVMVQFNEMVNATQVTSTINYALSGTAGLTGNPTQVERQANGKDALLTVADLSGMLVGQNVIVTVSNIADLNGNVIADNNVATYTLLDETPPVITLAAQAVTNDPGQVVLAQSNELGLIYLVLDGVAQTTLADLEAAVESGTALVDTVKTVDTDVSISVAGMPVGMYYAYAVDAFDNISAKSVNAVTLTDVTAPELTMIAQEVANSAIDQVFAMSNERGMIYLILEGEAQSTVAEFEAAIAASKGFAGAVSTINQDITLVPEGVVVGTYYGYAVDDAGNISAKSANAVLVNQFVPRVRYYDDTEESQLGDDIIAAVDGDVFILTTSGGDYAMQDWLKIEAKISIIADENLAAAPVFSNLKESNTTQILRFNADGAGIYAKGIIFDSKSREAGSFPLKYGIRSNANIGNYSLVLENCEFRGNWMANDGSAGCAIKLYDGTHGDSVIIKNCIFEGDEGIVFNSTSGVVNWDKFEISNTTFMNIPDDQAIQIVQKGEQKTLPFSIDHCTFYNVGGINEDPIRIDSLYAASVTNSIFASSPADTSFHMYGDATNKAMVDYSNFFEIPVPLTDEGGVLGTSIWTDDPQFADAANGDLTLGNQAMLTLGSDGLPLGDLRWADIFGPEVLASMTARSDSTLVLEFNEWVDTTTAIAAANYTISGSAGYSGNVKKAELYNFRSVLLTLESFTAQVGNEIVVTVSNVQDLKGNVVDPNHNKASYTVEEFRPVVTAEAQSATNGDDQSVIAQSNQGVGFVYIILDGEAQSTMAELDAAVAAMKGAKATVSVAYTDIAIAVSGLVPGTYYAYATDAAGNLSEKGANAITITDGILPVISIDIQSAENGVADFVIAQSNELGVIYIVMDGEPQETVSDLISATYVFKGKSQAIAAVNTDVQVSTNKLVPGIYYAYAVDEAGNKSLKGTSPLNITLETGIDEANANLKVLSLNGSIVVNTADMGSKIFICDILGRSLVNQALTSESTEFIMPVKGVYIVNIYNAKGIMHTSKQVVK